MRYQDGYLTCVCGVSEELQVPAGGLRAVIDGLEWIDAQIRSFQFAHGRCPAGSVGPGGEPSFSCALPTAKALVWRGGLL